MNLSEKISAIRDKSVELAESRGIEVTVDFGLTGRAAAEAYWKRKHISYNSLFVRDEFEDMLEDTVPHEVAHIVVNREAGFNQGHNSFWKRISRELGGNGSSCHDYDMSLIWKRRAKCECRTHIISDRKFTSMVKGKGRYCLDCGTELKPVRGEIND